MNSQDYYFQRVVQQLLHRLEQSDEDVTFNLKIPGDTTFMTFLEELNTTTDMLPEKEIKK